MEARKPSSFLGSIDRRLAAVGLLGLVAALAMVLLNIQGEASGQSVGDPYGYGAIARGFVEHGFDKVTRRAAMLYPHVLWGVYLVGGNDRLAQALNVLLHVGTCVSCFAIAKRLFNARTAWMAGAIVAVHPMLLRYVAELHTEALLTFLCTSVVWLAIRFDERPSVANGVLFGAVGMVGVFTKGTLLPVLVTFGVVWAVRLLRRAGTLSLRPIAGVIAIALTMIVIITPWTYRNYRVSGGRFVLLTPGSPDAFLRGYIFTRLEFATLQKPPYTDAENESNALFNRLAAEAGTTWEKDEIQDDVNNGKEAKRRIREEPLDTARKVVVGLFTFWYEMTSLKNSLVPATLALLAWAFAFVGFARAHRERQQVWLLLLPIVVTNVFVACLIPLGRYSVPILPCLTILAAFGVDTLLSGRAKAKARA